MWNTTPLTHVARLHDMPLRTVERWLAQYRRDGLVGLSRRRRSDQGHPRRLRPELKEVIEGLALRNPHLPWLLSIDKWVRRTPSWMARPPYASVYRVMKHLTPPWLHWPTTAAKLTGPPMISFTDAQPKGPTTSGRPITPYWILGAARQRAPARPWLTVIMDDYSRAIAGYGVSFHAPSAIQTALVLRQAIWRKPLPQWHICGLLGRFIPTMAVISSRIISSKSVSI